MEPDKTKPGLNSLHETPLRHARPKQTGKNLNRSGKARPGFLFLPHLVDTSTSSAFACLCLCELCVFDRRMEPDKIEPGLNKLDENPLGHAISSIFGVASKERKIGDGLCHIKDDYI